jgi:hypothetical protein
MFLFSHPTAHMLGCKIPEGKRIFVYPMLALVPKEIDRVDQGVCGLKFIQSEVLFKKYIYIPMQN